MRWNLVVYAEEILAVRPKLAMGDVKPWVFWVTTAASLSAATFLAASSPSVTPTECDSSLGSVQFFFNSGEWKHVSVFYDVMTNVVEVWDAIWI